MTSKDKRLEAIFDAWVNTEVEIPEDPVEMRGMLVTALEDLKYATLTARTLDEMFGDRPTRSPAKDDTFRRTMT